MIKEMTDHQMMSLDQYIETFYGGVKASFARAQGIDPQQVTQWMNKEYTVKGHTLYSPRRVLALSVTEKNEQNYNG